MQGGSFVVNHKRRMLIKIVLSLLLVIICEIAVDSKSVSKKSPKKGANAKMASQGKEECPDLFQQYYEDLIEENRDRYPNRPTRFRLQIEVNKGGLTDWEPSLSVDKDLPGYAKCYLETGKGNAIK